MLPNANADMCPNRFRFWLLWSGRFSMKLRMLSVTGVAFLCLILVPSMSQADGWFKAVEQGCLSVCGDNGLHPLYVGDNVGVNRSYVCRGWYSNMNRGGMNHETETVCSYPGGSPNIHGSNFYCYCTTATVNEQKQNWQK